MGQFCHTETIAKPQHRLYALIIDIENYPKIFPYCLAAKIHARNEGLDKSNNRYEQIDAELTLGFGVFTRKIVTRNHNYPENLIEVRLHSNQQKGAKKLEGFWELQKIDDNTTQVSCRFSYSFGKGLDMLFSRMLSSFIQSTTANLMRHGQENHTG